MPLSDLSAAFRTVTHAAGYLQELKLRAAALTAQVTAEPRGYFTPDEEEVTLGLLVSYWHTRCALVDLIADLRQAHRDRDPPHLAFLIGFAAAASLVDAARFLREVAELRPVVRDKLNQPVSQFAIPPGVYDTIQKSLLSARNGWMLLDAVQQYRRIRAELPAEPSAEIRQLLDIIESRLPQLEVSVLRFARAKLNTRADQLARQVREMVLDRTLYALQRLVGTLLSDKYVRRGHQPGLPPAVAIGLRALLQPGDVLVVRKEYALTNYFLPGYWPHAALYLGTASQFSELCIQEEPSVRCRQSRLTELAQDDMGIVLEAMKDGVHLRSLRSPFASDSAVILRPQLTRTEIARGIARVFHHENKPYDFDFDFRRSDRLVCTEVVYRAFDGLAGLRIPLVRRAGRPTLSGGDLIRYTIRRELFTPVAAYAPQMASGICAEGEAMGVLCAGQAKTEAEAATT